jgi:hypothetical protein
MELQRREFAALMLGAAAALSLAGRALYSLSFETLDSQLR